MVQHLKEIAANVCVRASFADGDVVLDIASNDGTLLANYDATGLVRIGIDPTIQQFAQYYPDDVIKVPDFFTASAFLQASGGQKARAITTIAMIYDLDDPNGFVADIREILAEDGIWVFEQSDLVSMLNSNSFDTICHEHLEFYGIAQLQMLLARNGLRIFDIIKSDVNGGSARLYACHAGAHFAANDPALSHALAEEHEVQMDPQTAFARFFTEAEHLRTELQALLKALKAEGKSVYLYGASTKGNVLLQFCGIGRDLVVAAAERNPLKFGSFTPGSDIPIISEEEARAARPDYFLVMPWHFRNDFISRERAYLATGGQFIFPRPRLEIVSRDTISSLG